MERGLDFSEKVQIVSEAISSSLNLLDFIVDTFKYRGVDLKVRGCNDALHIAPEVLAEIYQGLDPAVSGSVNLVHNQSNCLSACSQTPEMSKLVSHEIAFEQQRIKFRKLRQFCMLLLREIFRALVQEVPGALHDFS